MTQIYANNFTTLVLGRRGENLARKVVFDIRDLESLYGTGDVEVIYQRPGDAQPYPVAVQREGTLVTWDVTSTDTEMSDGSGKCELRYYVGETLAKSKTWQTWVEPAMDTPSETAPPEPEQGWVDQIIAVGAAAQASQTAAAGSASAAANSAASASAAASAASESATSAAESAAVYDTVVADVNQLKADLSAEQAAREQADTSLQQEVSGKLPKSPANWGPWTTEEQAAARDRIGIDKPFELIEEIVCDGEAKTYTRTVDVNGNPYNLLSVYIEFEIEIGNSYTEPVYFRAYDAESNTVLYDGGSVKQKNYVSYLLGGADAKNGMYQGWMINVNLPNYNSGGSSIKRISRRVPIISPIKKIHIMVGGELKFLSGDKIRIYGVRA